VSFDRPEVDIGQSCAAGRIFESMSQWRHRSSSVRPYRRRQLVFRHPLVTVDVQAVRVPHDRGRRSTTRISSLWSFEGGAGVVYLQPNTSDEAHTGLHPLAREPSALARRPRPFTSAIPGHSSVVRLWAAPASRARTGRPASAQPRFHFRPSLPPRYLDSSAGSATPAASTGVARNRPPPLHRKPSSTCRSPALRFRLFSGC